MKLFIDILLFTIFLLAVGIFSLYKEQEQTKFYNDNEIMNKDLDIKNLQEELKKCNDTLIVKKI